MAARRATIRPHSIRNRCTDPVLAVGEAEAVAERGSRSLRDTFGRLLPIELEKGSSR